MPRCLHARWRCSRPLGSDRRCFSEKSQYLSKTFFISSQPSILFFQAKPSAICVCFWNYDRSHLHLEKQNKNKNKTQINLHLPYSRKKCLLHQPLLLWQPQSLNWLLLKLYSITTLESCCSCVAPTKPFPSSNICILLFFGLG